MVPTLRPDVFEAVLSACGVPVSLVTDADGVGQRGTFGRFLTSAVESVTEELSTKLDTEISFRFDGLYAHDLQGRATSFQKLVAGGRDVSEAVAGLGIARTVPERLGHLAVTEVVTPK